MKLYKFTFLFFLSLTFIGNCFIAESTFAHKRTKKYNKKHWKKGIPRKMLFDRVLLHRIRLGLNKSQISKLENIKTNYIKNRYKNRAKLRINGVDLKMAIRAESINMKVIEKLVKKMTSQRETMWLSAISAIAKTKTILTNKQLEKMKKIRHSRMMRRKSRR